MDNAPPSPRVDHKTNKSIYMVTAPSSDKLAIAAVFFEANEAYVRNFHFQV